MEVTFIQGLIVFISLINSCRSVPPQTVTIGAIIPDEQTASENQIKVALDMAMDYVNNRNDVLPYTTLVIQTNTSDRIAATFEDIQNVCYQVKEGVSVVIGPGSSSSVKATYPIVAGSHIPQIAPFATDPTLSEKEGKLYPLLIKMSSPDNLQSRALVDLAQYYGWSRFAIIAELTDYGRNGIQEFQTIAAEKDWKISNMEYFYPSENVTGIDFTRSLLNIKNKGVRIILVNCMAVYARELLDQAYQLNMMGKDWAWLVTDGVTAINGLYNLCKTVPIHLRGLIGTRPTYAEGALFPMFARMWRNYTQTWQQNDLADTAAESLEIDDCGFCESNFGCVQGYTMRLFDAVLVAAYGLHQYFEDGHELSDYSQTESICLDKGTPSWKDGKLLFDYMHNVDIDGVMNPLSFQNGGTTHKNYEIVNLINNEWIVVGQWNHTNGTQGELEMDKGAAVVFPGRTTTVPSDTANDLNNVSLKIVTILEEPFVMLKDPNDAPSSNDGLKYKGFCIDLLLKLQEELGFNYTLYVVEDGNYGSQNETTQEWNGLVGDLVRGKADITIAPLTITFKRQQFVDFTKPYMDLGLLVLMAKKTSESSVLGFMEPFEMQLWVALGVAFLVFGIATTLCSFCSPYGHRGKYTQRADRKCEKNREGQKMFSFWNSLWYTYASWMQQGAEVSPTCFSGRIVYGFWYFAVMVISATYTANLAAFLTVARLDTGINSIDDLAAQNRIKYGTVANSAVEKFFVTQTGEPYTRMAAFMDMEDTAVQTASEGIQKVRASNNATDGGTAEQFAFIFDSTILEYETRKAPCETITVGSLFNQVGYGIGLQKNSPYLQAISLKILKLRQDGTLERLKSKHINSGACNGATDDGAVSAGEDQATLQNMSGIFYFLSIGLGIGFIVLFGEWIVASCRESFSRDEGGRGKSCCGAFARRAAATCGAVGEIVCPCCCKEAEEERTYSEKGHSNHAFPDLEGSMPTGHTNGLAENGQT